MAETDCASESASSVCDEERVKRLFQACDANGDGYIDSQDLLAICRELSLEDSLDELMLQLGADSQGRISYEQFLQRRLALRPEIDALKNSNNSINTRDNSSEISQGKLDSWEWDSGARDMSPVPKTITKSTKKPPEEDSTFKERLQQQLDEQAQRYEEQLTELHSVIAELTRKLHQQRTMAIAEEDEVSESCASAHEDSVTCPLEVSELEPLDNELSDLDNKLSESPLELPEPTKLSSSLNNENNDELCSPFHQNSDTIVDSLKREITNLKAQLQEAHSKLSLFGQQKQDLQEKYEFDHFNNKNADILTIEEEQETLTCESKILESPESHLELDCDPKLYLEPEVDGSIINNKLDVKYSNIVPIHRSSTTNLIQKNNMQNIHGGGNTVLPQIPVSKMAERIKLKKVTDNTSGSVLHQNLVNCDLVNGDLPTAVAEHIVGDILRQCDAVQSEKQAVDVELRRLSAKLEHARSQNSVLAITLSETKAHCDRLALLCGKYESNAISLRLALGLTDRAIEAYDVLLALLETELSLDDADSPDSARNRTAAESVAMQLLNHLDSHQSTEVLLSPWQNHVYNSPIMDSKEPWSAQHETRLREHVSRLKAERSNIQGTYVVLESTYVENVPVRPSSSQEARKMDLEMAVLLQELMGLREDKAELISKLFVSEKDKSALDLKLKYVEGQQKAQAAALRNLQGQLKDTEALLALATQSKDIDYSDAEHAQGVEFELMQALAREARLKVRLQELVNTLEQVTKNAEARLIEGREIVHDLSRTNSILAETVDRNNKKYQTKFKKMEHQMLAMAEKHNTQVQNLQQKIATLETPPTNSSDNSINSVAV